MEYFKNLLRLIQLEKHADKDQHNKSLIINSLEYRVKKGLSWYPVRITRKEIGLNDNFQITVEKIIKEEIEHKFQVGKMVQLFDNSRHNIEENSVLGSISAIGKDYMRITFDFEELTGDLDWLDYSSGIGINRMFSMPTYSKMESAIQNIIKSRKGRINQLQNVLLGKKSPSFSTQLPNNYSDADFKRLNDSQTLAVKNILRAKDVAIIHGPPGTGKTTSLVEAIYLTLRIEKQVLVTAPSNTAVDKLTIDLAKRGVNVLRLGNASRIEAQANKYSIESKMEDHEDFFFLKDLRDRALKYSRLSKYHSKSSKRGKNKRLAEFHEKNYQELRKKAKVMEKYILKQLLEEAEAITVTLVGAVSTHIHFRRFSTVFIDEAAQALEPACWIPITKTNRVIFAGDDCQLPPIVKSEEAKKEGLGISLFEKVRSAQEVDVMLQTQYRMHEHIMNFSSQVFYEKRLMADESVRYRLLSEDKANTLLSSPITFIDTAGCNFFDEKDGGTYSKSRFNSKEAKLLVKHLTILIQNISENEPMLLKKLSVGIISPYKAQVTYIKNLVDTHPPLKNHLSQIQVNSIDGFQGQEKDIIYLSLVRSNIQKNIGFLDETRRMNVALTRAKKKLVVLGDSNTLCTIDFYGMFLSYIQQIDAYQHAKNWI